MYLPLRGQSLPLYFYTQWGVVWLPLMSYYPGSKLLDTRWHWCPSQKHNIQVWARQPHNRSDDESGLGTSIVFGESGQDVVWIPACRSVQCVVTRRGWWRWWHPATSLIRRVGCIGCWCRCCKWGPSLNGWLEEIVFWKSLEWDHWISSKTVQGWHPFGELPHHWHCLQICREDYRQRTWSE